MARDPYEYFRIEARELLDQLGKGVLDLERGNAAAGHVARLLRVAHTLKGAARVVKQREIAEMAHAIEDALVPFRDGGEEAARSVVTSLLERIDVAGAHLAKIAVADAPARPAGAAPAAEEQPWVLRAEAAEVTAVVDGIAEVASQLVKIKRASESVRRARHLAELTAAQTGESAAATAVRSRLIEDLRSLLEDIETDLTASVEQADRDLRQVREAGDRLQLLPVAMMFNVLERAVRDAAVSGGKRVAFAPGSSDLRIEAGVLGAVQKALLHVVRNAVAHGIEPEGARIAQGKPPQGRVALDVVRRGDRLAFVCTDDGRGIDVEAVRRAAARRGISEEAVGRLGAEELVRLLLRGGISTSANVTELSGRGVGLDVVRETAARLGGEVDVRTAPHRGTTIELIVPLRAAALDALFMESAGEIVAIPLASVRRTLVLRSSAVVRAGDLEAMAVDGRMLPFASLARILGTATPQDGGSHRGSGVVVSAGDEIAVVGADRLIGVENVVVRALPVAVPVRPIVSGVALDVAGDPQLVLDPEHVVTEARSSVVAPALPRARPPILVIDDSLTTRMLEQSILESAGYRVDVATSAEEGMEKAKEREYGLFLVDVEMPGMDGFTFVERTRADPVLSRVPAILVSSRAAPDDLRRGEAAGAKGYMVKSEFDQRELLERIRSLVG